MSFLNQVDHIELNFPTKRHEPDATVRIECGRLIHAAVISQRFQKKLLANPIKTIDEGYCGEKFAFTHAEKQRIRLIRANNLAEFSSQLLHAVEYPASVSSPKPEMAFAW